MSEYYAIQRSEEYLAHYGIRGMKWGVRKALAKSTSAGTNKALAKQYKKASKKLAKLQAHTDVNKQKLTASVEAKKAARTGTATAGLAGVTVLGRKNSKETVKVPAHFTADFMTGKTIHVPEMTKEVQKPAGAVHYALGALTAAGAAKTAYHTGKAIAAKRRTTVKGHAKAVAKANAWKKEMDSAFAGTKYGKKNSNKKRR